MALRILTVSASSSSSKRDISQLKPAVAKHCSCLNDDMVEDKASLQSFMAQKEP